MEFLVLPPLAQETPPSPGPAETGAGTTQVPAEGDQPLPPPGGGGMYSQLILMVLIIGVFYFVMIGPERKQRKRREAMLAAVKKGDKVITTGGMYATVAAVTPDSITLQASDDVRLRFSRQAIAQVLEDGAEGSAKP